ncbi:MAG: hypothetical protein LAP87_18445 [Acidobacteriia bacterium]|nr:hypothetical protein [Terriglobia bacterium]
MKRLTIALAFSLASLLPAQDGQKAEVRVAPTSELFTEEVRAARQLHGEWDLRDDELDAARHGASLSNPDVYKGLRTQIESVLAAKRRELDAWSVYYQKTADYWQSVFRAIQAGQPARSSERQDLVNMLAQEQRDRGDVQRRLNDLEQTLREKNVAASQPAALDLKKLLDLKADNVAKLERAIQEFDGGGAHLDRRRELAQARAIQSRQLLRGVETERPLWDALYNGRLHRLDLEYDTNIPEPEARPDWRRKAGTSPAGGGTTIPSTPATKAPVNRGGGGQ